MHTLYNKCTAHRLIGYNARFLPTCVSTQFVLVLASHAFGSQTVAEALAYFPCITQNKQINVSAAPPLHLINFQWDVVLKTTFSLFTLWHSFSCLYSLVSFPWNLFGLFWDYISWQCVTCNWFHRTAVVSTSLQDEDSVSRFQMATDGIGSLTSLLLLVTHRLHRIPTAIVELLANPWCSWRGFCTR